MIIIIIFDMNIISGQEVNSVNIDVADTNAAILTNIVLFIYNSKINGNIAHQS